MIIKKKYTTIKNFEKEPQTLQADSDSKSVVYDDSLSENKLTDTESEKKAVEKEDNELKEEVSDNTLPKQKKNKKTMEDLDLTLDNIKFEPREERREGSRRRGYRRTQDRNLVSRAQKEADAIKEAAKKDGYKEGIDSAQKDIDELKSKFAEFFNIKEEVFNKVSDCIMDISVEIAKKIINKTVETDREYIIPMIRGAVEEVNKTENKIVLRVMPKDAEIVKDNISDIFSENNIEATVSVIPDKEVNDGGVIIETSNGIIDASITTQLAIIEKAFKKQEES